MESNARYYARRAVEERMKAQRAITEQARAWHAKLAHDFAERANANANSISNDSAPAAISA
jgi:N-acetyl-anhydromuramyl-L-alanine amidase AmpD